MPSYKVGATGEGGVAAMLDFVQQRQAQQREDELEYRKFRQRVQTIVLSKPDVSEEFIQAMLTGQDTTNVPFHEPVTPNEFLPRATSRLEKSLPETPFIAGPEGSFLGGDNVEALPGFTVPRQQVVEGMAPDLAGRMSATKAMGEMQPVYSRTGSGVDQIGYAPKNARILSSGGGGQDLLTQLLSQGSAGGGLDPATQSVIEDIQSGQATVEEFVQHERLLQSQGVDTAKVRQVLGI